jgi:hypothetical protein
MKPKYSFEVKFDKNGGEYSKYIVRMKLGDRCILAPRAATLKESLMELADCVNEYVPTEQAKIKIEINYK